MIGLSWMRIVVVLALALALVGAVWKFYRDVRESAKLEGRMEAIEEMRVKIDAQKAEAATLLEAERTKTAKAERELREFKDAQEVKDVDARKHVDELSARLRSLGRLRDPNATPADTGCGPSRGGPETAVAAAPSAGRDNPTEAGGVLSREATALLLELTAEADAINIAYRSCRAYVQQVHSTMTP